MNTLGRRKDENYFCEFNVRVKFVLEQNLKTKRCTIDRRSNQSMKLKFKIFTILDQTDFFAKHSIFLGLEECNPLYFYLLNGSFFMAPKS